MMKKTVKTKTISTKIPVNSVNAGIVPEVIFTYVQDAVNNKCRMASDTRHKQLFCEHLEPNVVGQVYGLMTKTPDYRIKEMSYHC